EHFTSISDSSSPLSCSSFPLPCSSKHNHQNITMTREYSLSIDEDLEPQSPPRYKPISVDSLLNQPQSAITAPVQPYATNRPRIVLPAPVQSYGAFATPYAPQAPKPPLHPPTVRTGLFPNYAPPYSTTGPVSELHQEYFNKTEVSPSALYIKSKRRSHYTNRLKAEVLDFWLQPVETKHRSGHRTLQEVAEHTKIPLETLRGWTRKDHKEHIFAAEAGLSNVTSHQDSPLASSSSPPSSVFPSFSSPSSSSSSSSSFSSSSFSSSSSSSSFSYSSSGPWPVSSRSLPTSPQFTALNKEPPRQSIATAALDRRFSPRKCMHLPSPGVSTKETTRWLEPEAEIQIENPGEERRQVNPYKRRCLERNSDLH
ncbi:hypothetical protein BZA77DRAFT_121340, partial [Pyronema omphalodes]